jgi:hypothetical protein
VENPLCGDHLAQRLQYSNVGGDGRALAAVNSIEELDTNSIIDTVTLVGLPSEHSLLCVASEI